jgi:type I restriction enzyme S subunit
MMRIRVRSPALARWIWRYCSSSEARDYFVANATGTAGNMPKINGSTVRNLLVPVPPLYQLDSALSKLDLRLESVDLLQNEAARAQLLLQRLERAALDQAFERQ